MVNVYSIPAIMALVAKGATLVFSHRAEVQNFHTRLFTAAVPASIGLSVVEATELIYGFHSEYRYQFGVAYIAFAILVLATLVHLTMVVTFSRPRPFIIFALSGYAALLALLLFSSRLRQREVQAQIKAKLDALLEKFARQGTGVLDKPLEEHLSEVEALLLKQAIECCGGNRSAVARFLGMRPNTLHYKLERYGLLPEKLKQSP